MGDSQKDRAPICKDVIDPVRNGDTDGVRAKIMIVDEDGRSTPSCSRIFKVADEFTLLGIDADDGMVPTLERSSKLRDVFELLIAIRARVGREHLVIDAERVAHLVKQAGDSIGRNEDSQFGEKDTNPISGSTTPFQSANRVAAGIVLKERFDGGDYFGRFFSTGLRPAPARRMRPISTSWSSNCCRPRATV